MNSSRRKGTTLVEILVVIVIFMVGILAVVQVFPNGFRALSTTQKNSQATALGRDEQERLKSRVNQMPDAISPVDYIWTGSQVLIQKQPDRFPGDLGPNYATLDTNGNFRDTGGNPVGNWQFLTGGNIARRVIGEGKIIPSPRLVNGQYGSLLRLLFAPVVYNPNFVPFFEVYGNDMGKHEGDPTADPIVPVRNGTDYYVDNEDTSDPVIYVPESAAKQLNYVLEITAWVGGQRHDYTGVPISANLANGWTVVHLNAGLYLGPVDGVEYDSISLARRFDDVSALASNDWGAGVGMPVADPYEFKLLSPQLGVVLFNPSGYNYIVRSRGKRNPLIGRVSYDVFDWRIIHDEFRMPDNYPGQYKLALSSLKVIGQQGPDGKTLAGIGVQAPDSTGTFNNVDLVLQDTDDGGLYVFQEGTKDPHLTSFLVNKSSGVISFLDYDSDPSNGTQMMLLEPGAATPTVVTVSNRSLEALYMGKNEWAVQVLKAAATYHEVWLRPGIQQFYIGQSDPNTGGLGDRVYFPPADAGRLVSFGDIYYFNPSGQEIGPVTLTAKLETTAMDAAGLPTGNLPYVKMSNYFPDFGSFDYNYMSAVKNVKGASVAVRVLWNPDSFTLNTDSPTNMDNLDKWMQGWRRQTVETYLQRGYSNDATP